MEVPEKENKKKSPKVSQNGGEGVTRDKRRGGR
jgi:hypothetical protein